MRKSKAFTLVELLVVIGIIALLISILMPTLNRARAAARKAQCLSNMRQVGMGLQMYTIENKTWLPPVHRTIGTYDDVADFGEETVYIPFPNFLGSLIPYMQGNRKVFICPEPESTEMAGAGPGTGAITEKSDTNYLGNAAVMGRKVTKIRKSSEIIYLQEMPHRWGLAAHRPTRHPAFRTFYTHWHDSIHYPNSHPLQYQYSYLHQKGGNVVFVDGHAEYRKASSLRASDFGLTGGGGATGRETDTQQAAPTLLYRSIFP